MNELAVALVGVECAVLNPQTQMMSAGTVCKSWLMRISVPCDAQGLPQLTPAQFQVLCDEVGRLRPHLVKPVEPEREITPEEIAATREYERGNRSVMDTAPPAE